MNKLIPQTFQKLKKENITDNQNKVTLEKAVLHQVKIDDSHQMRKKTGLIESPKQQNKFYDFKKQYMKRNNKATVSSKS